MWGPLAIHNYNLFTLSYEEISFCKIRFHHYLNRHYNVLLFQKSMASMMISDEEKRWVVVGIAMQTIAPVLRSFVKQGMESHYNIMDGYLSNLSTPCTLSTLTILQLSIDSTLKRLKFENVNDNIQTHGKQKQLYNYNVCSPVDLAKLYLPDYLAQFSSFDDSLDMTGILRLLGVDRPAPIFQSRNPLISIQFAADEVRENVRNKWAHFEAAEWSEEFFKECFDKLEKLVKSLQLTDGVEKSTLEQLSDWEKRGI